MYTSDVLAVQVRTPEMEVFLPMVCACAYDQIASFRSCTKDLYRHLRSDHPGAEVSTRCCYPAVIRLRMPGDTTKITRLKKWLELLGVVIVAKQPRNGPQQDGG